MILPIAQRFSFYLLVGGLFFSTARIGAEEVILEKVLSIAEVAVTSPSLPGGSIRVIRDQEILLDRGFGKVDSKGTRDWRTDEVVGIASMTKPITATLVAILVEEGKLEFSDPVSKYLPEYSDPKLPNGNTVRSPTIAECLSHTAGFRGGTVRDLPKTSAIFTDGTQAAVVAEILEKGLVARPGTRYAYTYRGFAVVAAIVEKISNQRYSEVLRNKLLEPLQMKETAFAPSLEMVSRIPAFAGKNPAPAAVAQYLKKREERWENPAGGLLSTASDLTKFYQFHLDRGRIGEKVLVSPEVLRKLYQRQPAAKNYGLGFQVERPGKLPLLQHGGASGTLGWVDLKSKTIFIGLTQAGSKNARGFLRNTSAAIRGR